MKIEKLEWLPMSLPWVLNLDDPNVLGVPVTLEVTRTAELRLLVTAVGNGRLNVVVGGEAGTMMRCQTLSLRTARCEPVTMDGFLLESSKTKTYENRKSETHIHGRASKVSVVFSEGEPRSTSEWLGHVPTLIWSRVTKRDTEIKSTRTRDSRVLHVHGGSEQTSRDYTEIEIGSERLRCVHLGCVHPDNIPKGHSVDRPGFLEFHAGKEGLPDESMRFTVRRALEFLLGTSLPVFGRSEIDGDGKVLLAILTSAYAPGGSGPPSPPALLSELNAPEGLDRLALDEAILGKFVKQYLSLEKAYDLNRAVSLFLHARNAPLEIAAVFVGSAFEVLRRGYYNQPENEERSRLITKEKWKKLSEKIHGFLTDLAKNENCNDVKDGLNGVATRIGNLNSVSGTRLNIMFLNDLGLNHGDIEDGALQARNDAAHANPVELSNYEDVLRRYRALHTLTARVMLCYPRCDRK